MNKLPSDWQIKTLNEVCNIYTGNSINKKKKEENFIGLKEGLNYIGTKDISFNNIIEYENGVKIPFKDLKDFKIAKSNTSLLCIEGGSAGRKIGFTNQDVCFGNKLCCFEAIEDEPKFIYFYHIRFYKLYISHYNFLQKNLLFYFLNHYKIRQFLINYILSIRPQNL